jgi:hypothetical protein
MPTFLLILLLAAADDSIRFESPEIRLWPNGAPGSEGETAPETWNPSTDGFHRVTNIHNPSITAFLPPKEKANGAAFIVCPGGGHAYLVMDLEGSLVAKKLNEMGVAAFVLKSRLARAPGSKYKVEWLKHVFNRLTQAPRIRLTGSVRVRILSCSAIRESIPRI